MAYYQGSCNPLYHPILPRGPWTQIQHGQNASPSETLVPECGRKSSVALYWLHSTALSLTIPRFGCYQCKLGSVSISRFRSSPPPPPLASNTTMDLPPIPLLQRQLETTLQLLLSLSSMMTDDDVMLVKIRLTEANLLMTSVLTERSNSTSNGSSTPTPLLLFT